MGKAELTLAKQLIEQGSAEKFDPTRLERACEKALAIQSPGYRTVKTLLEQRMEAAPLRSAEASSEDEVAHLGAANVRGRGYYH